MVLNLLSLTTPTIISLVVGHTVPLFGNVPRRNPTHTRPWAGCNTFTTSILDSYVDDSKLYKSFCIYDLEQTTINLEADLQIAAKWCLEHQLLINPGKTKFLLVGSRPMLQKVPTEMSLTFLGKTIRPVLLAKDLGINLDSYLSYDDHISKLVSSCMRKLCQVNRVKDSFDNETLKLVIETLVISKLLYCSTLWSNTSSNNINKLQSINFSCRVISGVEKFDHITPALRELNWLPVEKLLFEGETVTYKCFNGIAPDYQVDKFIKRSDIHDRSTRNHDLLDTPCIKLLQVKEHSITGLSKYGMTWMINYKILHQ